MSIQLYPWLVMNYAPTAVSASEMDEIVVMWFWRCVLSGGFLCTAPSRKLTVCTRASLDEVCSKVLRREAKALGISIYLSTHPYID